MPSDSYTLIVSDASIAAPHASTHGVAGADAVSISATQVTAGTLPVLRGGTGVTTSTGSGSNVLSSGPILTAPVLGTPASGSILTNCTGLPLATGVSGTLPVGSGGTGVTTSTGSGDNVLSTSPTLVTPALGTPASGTLTNCTGFPVAGVSGLGTGVATFLATPSSANLAAAVTDETGSGALVFATNPTLDTPNLGTPTAGVLTSCTGLPLTTGVSGLGTGVATFLATPSSANLVDAVTDETGSGSLVFATSPTLTAPVLGTPAAGSILTNCTGLPLTTGVTGTLPVANGGTNLSSYTTGDILYASGTTALAKLSAVAAGSVLLSGTTPSYGKVILTTGSTQHVTGTLPVANGGTGLATITGYVKGTGTSPLSTSATIPVADISGTLPVANGGTGATQSAYGEYYISSITATSISPTGTFVKVNGTTTAGFLSNFTHPASNNLTYTGTATRKFLITAALSFHGTATNDYKFAFHKNTSSLLSPSIISTTGAGAGDLAHVSCQTIVELATNDFIEVFVTNADAANSTTVDFMNVTAVALI